MGCYKSFWSATPSLSLVAPKLPSTNKISSVRGCVSAGDLAVYEAPYSTCYGGITGYLDMIKYSYISSTYYLLDAVKYILYWTENELIKRMNLSY